MNAFTMNYVSEQQELSHLKLNFLCDYFYDIVFYHRDPVHLKVLHLSTAWLENITTRLVWTCYKYNFGVIKVNIDFNLYLNL